MLALKRTKSLLVLTSILTFISAGADVKSETETLTEIDKYVRATDDSYSWRIHSSSKAEGYQEVIVDMVSQNWLTTEEVNRTEWRHWLVLTIPSNVQSETALLFIGGGSNKNDNPQSNEMTRQIALATNTVVAELGMVPNQPLVFKSDETQRERSEDDLIAYAWTHYFESKDGKWLPRGPMVKSAVRAMDTVSALTASDDVEINNPVKNFVVAGGSKRGWTAWLTAAMDDRVIAVAPIVIDVLNVADSMRHHFAAYGFYAPSISNYVENGFMQQWENPLLGELYSHVDPYFYLDRIEIPKLILNASGDQFFLPDSSQFYWDAVKEPRYLRYVPNANHSLNDSNGVETLTAFYASVVNGIELPVYDWSISPDGDITVSTESEPLAVHLWQANNPVARDFRVEAIGHAYTSEEIKPSDDGLYVASAPDPERGWTAYFVELTWDVGAPVPLRLSTEVIVTPDHLPFKDKDLNQPSSISLICTMSSEQGVNDIMAIVNAIEDQSFTKNGIQTKTWGHTLYINWTPADVFIRGFFEMAGLLEQSGCEKRSFQLESGPDITLPPLAPPTVSSQ